MIYTSEQDVWSVTDILNATGGQLFSGKSDCIFNNFFIDSRQQISKALFIAIQGVKHDGHAFVIDVLEKGTAGVIIENTKACNFPITTWRQKGICCIGVDNTTCALGQLAHYHRIRQKAAIITITGSNGKTTTREMTASVLSQKLNVHSSYGNFNNEIGVPLTLLKLTSAHEAAVVEIGMNHFGEIAQLTRICEPDIGVITNIGPAHLEGVGSLEGVMKAKGELLENMKSGNTAVLNADDPMVMRLSKQYSLSCVFYGKSDKSDIRWVSQETIENASKFILSMPGSQISIRLSVPGSFMISNAAAAAAVGFVLKLTPQEIAAGLESFRPVKGRMTISQTRNGVHVIDDTYNANPASTEAAIRTLASLKGKNRGIAVIGDMRELGDKSAELHQYIGSIAGSSGLSKLYVTGNFADDIIFGAIQSGMPSSSIVKGTKEDILQDLPQYLKPEDWVLVKGSRAMEMEVISEYLKLN